MLSTTKSISQQGRGLRGLRKSFGQLYESVRSLPDRRMNPRQDSVSWRGIVRPMGPMGEATPEGPGYWVQEVRPRIKPVPVFEGSILTHHRYETLWEAVPNGRWIVTINLAEVESQTHDIPDETIVDVFLTKSIDRGMPTINEPAGRDYGTGRWSFFPSSTGNRSKQARPVARDSTYQNLFVIRFPDIQTGDPGELAVSIVGGILDFVGPATGWPMLWLERSDVTAILDEMGVPPLTVTPWYATEIPAVVVPGVPQCPPNPSTLAPPAATQTCPTPILTPIVAQFTAPKGGG